MKKTTKGSVAMALIDAAIERYRQNHTGMYLPTKNSCAYQRVREVIENKQQSIRTGYTRGTGRRSQAVDITRDVCRLLDIASIAYECGNDAPRGGVNGNFVKIITKIQ